MGQTERELAARITVWLNPGAQFELEPGSTAEQDALATALSQLIWDRHGGQLLRRLHDAVVAYPLDAPEPTHDEAADVTPVGELLRPPKSRRHPRRPPRVVDPFNDPSLPPARQLDFDGHRLRPLDRPPRFPHPSGPNVRDGRQPGAGMLRSLRHERRLRALIAPPQLEQPIRQPYTCGDELPGRQRRRIKRRKRENAIPAVRRAEPTSRHARAVRSGPRNRQPWPSTSSARQNEQQTRLADGVLTLGLAAPSRVHVSRSGQSHRLASTVDYELAVRVTVYVAPFSVTVAVSVPVLLLPLFRVKEIVGVVDEPLATDCGDAGVRLPASPVSV